MLWLQLPNSHRVRCFSTFYFILAFRGTVLANYANFCIRLWCFLSSPTCLEFYFVRWYGLFPPIKGIDYKLCPSLWCSCLSVDRLWVSDTCRSPCVSVQLLPSWSWTWAQQSNSPVDRKCHVFLRENLLFREASRVLTTMKQEMDVAPYVSWKHVAVFLWIM